MKMEIDKSENYSDLFPARNENPLLETNNPGTQNDHYVSYAGKYFADNGTKSK